MNVKGFIIEDDQGREFVMTVEQPHVRSAKTFALRGWQRRRLVPLQYTEPELRQIVAGVLVTLNDLFESLPRLVEGLGDAPSDQASSMTTLLKTTTENKGGHMMN